MSDKTATTVELRFEERRSEATIAWVVIRNEAKLNVLNTRVMTDLVAAFAALSANAALRAVVLTGGGQKAFIGGADIDEMVGLDKASAGAFITRLHEVCQSIRDLPVPVIARLNGFALGGGMEVAAACDMRVAARSARFGMPEVQLGIPSVIEAALLPGLIGWGKTRRLLLLGDLISAEEAARWGFLEGLVDDDALDAAVEEWLEVLLRAGPAAVRAQKALVRRWEGLPLAQAIEAGITSFRSAFEGDEPARMMREFIERREAARRARRESE